MMYGWGNVEIWTRKAPTLKKRHVPLDKPHSEIYISAQVSIASRRHMKIRADLIFEFDKCVFR